MDEKEFSNKVSQHNNIIQGHGDVVGRDKIVFGSIIINIHLSNYQDLINLIIENERLTPFELSKDIFIQKALDQIKKSYANLVRVDTTMSKKNYSQNIIDGAALPMEQQNFGKAHKIYAAAIEDQNDEHFNLLFKDYLITGFIHYSQENDMEGLRALLSKKASVLTLDDPEIDLITANIFQELCSREADLIVLGGYMTELESLYKNAPLIVKPAMANSLGLAYRRMGERTGTHLLQKAITIFDEALGINKDDVVMEVDIKDQKAITYVRIFEFNKKTIHLTEAEKLLNECVASFTLMTDYRGIRLKPRVLNNLGNVYKQKALILETKKIENAKEAIKCYEAAEVFWTEPLAKYEWALLQKNKAEAKYALAKVNHDRNLLLDALKDCGYSVKYRNFENSPYQWGKTVEISFQIVILLKELNSLTIIPDKIRENIISYTKQIDLDDSIWVAKNFTNFLTNAKLTQTLLKN